VHGPSRSIERGMLRRYQHSRDHGLKGIARSNALHDGDQRINRWRIDRLAIIDTYTSTDPFGDVHYISGLMKHRVPLIVTELGADTDPFCSIFTPPWRRRSAG
jgi:hypothetical protein